MVPNSPRVDDETFDKVLDGVIGDYSSTLTKLS